MLMGGFLAIWAGSLIVRAIGMRIEEATARRLAAAGRQVPAFSRGRQLMGARGGLRLGLGVLPVAVLIAAAAVTMEWWMAGQPLASSLGGMWTTSASLLLVLAVAVAFAGVWFDTSRGRARCPACWYDLDPAVAVDEGGNLAEVTCPECGRKITDGSDLFRTRRKPSLIRLAMVLVLAAYVAFKVPEMVRWGPRGIIPTTALIAGFEWWPEGLVLASGRANGTREDSLQMRVAMNQVWGWQYALLTWKGGRLARTSLDVSTIHRALALTGDRNRTVPFARLDVLVDAIVDDDPVQATRAGWIAREALEVDWDAYPVSSAVAGRVDELAALLTDRQRGPGVWNVIAFAGPAADRHIEAIEGVLRSSTGSQGGFPNNGAMVLAELAARSDVAYERLARMCEDDLSRPGGLRGMAVQGLASIAAKRPESEALLRRLAEEASPMIYNAATEGLAAILTPDELAGILMVRIKSRMALNGDLLAALSRAVDRGAAITGEMATMLRGIIEDPNQALGERIRACSILANAGRSAENFAVIDAFARSPQAWEGGQRRLLRGLLREVEPEERREIRDQR